MTHRHKGCLFCEIEKVIERSIKKGDYDLAKVLFVISQVLYRIYPPSKLISDEG